MRKRSSYKPRRVIANTMEWVKASVSLVMSNPSATTLKIKNYDALDTLRLGKATRHDMDVLVNVVNMAEAFAMCDKKFADDFYQLISDAQTALLEVCNRGKDRNHFVCRASELEAIRDVMELHDAQLDIATVKEMEQAYKMVKTVIEQKKAVVI